MSRRSLRWPQWAVSSGSCARHQERGCPECMEPLDLTDYIPTPDIEEASDRREDAESRYFRGWEGMEP